jgi:outer membrane protein OmpA-like peptidoglycan-associated protein
VIRTTAARIAAAALLAAGLAIAPLLDNGDTTENPLASAPIVESPRFQIRWRNDEITLSGHTMSAQQEQALAEQARSTYPDASYVTDFKPLGVVPGYWGDIIVQSLYLLAGTRSAEATVSTAEIEVRGVVDDKTRWQYRLAEVKKAMPREVTVSTDMLFVGSGVNVSDLCRRAFKTFVPGSIEFEESNAELRSSAYPRLDRVIALSETCKQSRILITGHTDASGDAAFNRILSLRRAETVADYLTKGGIDRARLTVRGAGSTLPIADDSTRHGRSLNRRIEIDFELL